MRSIPPGAPPPPLLQTVFKSVASREGGPLGSRCPIYPTEYLLCLFVTPPLRVKQYKLPKLMTRKILSASQFSFDFSEFVICYLLSGWTRSCLNLAKPSRRERITRSVSEIAAPLSDWTLAASIGLNTNILEINLINLILVVGILFYYGKGVCASRISE